MTQGNILTFALEYTTMNRLQSGELTDSQYPGLEHVVSCLCRTKDVDAVFSAARWVLARDPSAVRIFTDRDPADSALFRHDDVRWEWG